jgi:hypothetical protein
LSSLRVSQCYSEPFFVDDRARVQTGGNRKTQVERRRRGGERTREETSGNLHTDRQTDRQTDRSIYSTYTTH